MDFGDVMARCYVYYATKFVYTLGMLEWCGGKWKTLTKLLVNLEKNDLGDLECLK